MRRSTFITRSAAALCLLGLSAAGGAAQADPARSGFPIKVSCGDKTFDAFVSGGGEFTPAHIVNSTSMVIPVAFGTTVISVDGVVVDTLPSLTKGSSTRNPVATTACTYSASFTENGSVVTAEGSLTGIITPVG